jgi:hypothetical protein
MVSKFLPQVLSGEILHGIGHRKTLFLKSIKKLPKQEAPLWVRRDDAFPDITISFHNN